MYILHFYYIVYKDKWDLFSQSAKISVCLKQGQKNETSVIFPEVIQWYDDMR